jgi:hypothetical protein
MIWIALYIPVAFYLWWAYTSRLEPLSLALVTVVVAGFCAVEFSQLRRDAGRPRAMMAILCITLCVLVIGMLYR